MGNYEISSFRPEVQQLILEKRIDDGNGVIEKDKGELANLLSATNSNSAEKLLESKYSFKYETNSESNVFLKDYLKTRATDSGIVFPEGMKINISSPKEFSSDFIELLKDVRVNVYGARAHDMLNLLVQEEEIVLDRVSNMKISDEEKSKIITLKNLFDKYYKMEAVYNGKSYNLLSSSCESLDEISPEFANFMQKEIQELRKNTMNLTRNEVSAEAHKEAAKESVNFIPTLCTILGASAAIGLAKSGYDAYRIKYAPIIDDLTETFKTTKKGLNPVKWFNASKDFAKGFYKNSKNKKFYSAGMREYLNEQKVLAEAGKLKLVNPITSIAQKIKKAPGKWGVVLALATTAIFTALGATDDCCGCIKDYKQDKNNFGEKFAKPVAYASGAWGILTSFAVAETIDNATSVMRARNIVNRNSLGKHASKMAKLLNKFSKANLRTAGVLGLLGIVVAMCSSGSSHASLLLTRWKFGKNGDQLEEKNIITKEENTFKAANENMTDYAAYYGKIQGVLNGPCADPILGFVTGASGLLFNANSYISGATFAAQGSSETWIASIWQSIDEKVRQRKIEKEKQALLATL